MSGSPSAERVQKAGWKVGQLKKNLPSFPLPIGTEAFFRSSLTSQTVAVFYYPHPEAAPGRSDS